MSEDITDRDIVDAMTQVGGHFIRTLAALWLVADDVNRATIAAAWPRYWSHYRDVARMLAERKREAHAE